MCSFTKSWNVCNNGTETWPPGCYVQCSDGDRMNGCRRNVPCLQSGEAFLVIIDMKSPAIPGTYQSKWRLCTPSGTYFGGKSINFGAVHKISII